MAILQCSLLTAVIPNQYIPGILGVLGVAIFVLVIWNVMLGKRLNSVRKVWDGITDGVEGENLERLLQDQLRQNIVLEGEIGELKERLDRAETRLRSSKRYVGVVRYNAFEDVGGEQSFAMAVYDEDGNGAVVTSQVGRNDCRVFGKSLVNGKSELNLTVEEQRAIEQAASSRNRPRISP